MNSNAKSAESEFLKTTMEMYVDEDLKIALFIHKCLLFAMMLYGLSLRCESKVTYNVLDVFLAR